MDKLKILAIDDEEEILFALRAIFDSQNWESVTVTNVEDGIKALEEDNEPDLVIIDYHMPRTNGLEGVKKIREVNEFIPIIVFTVDESQEVADSFLDAGANDFALKPIKAPDLISRINIHVKLMESRQKTIAEIEPEMPLRKGIRLETLQLIDKAMRDTKDYMTVEEIAENTGLAQQTSYRYLQFMEDEEYITIKNVYGKVGRPKQMYKIIKE